MNQQSQSAGISEKAQAGNRKALFACSFLMRPPPNHLQSSCFCFVLFFQSRESFQKILEINPQLQKQVKGENVPADVFHLNPTFPSCSGLGLPSTRSLHLATKPQSGFAYTVTSSMITGCPAALLCSPTQRLCLPPFYIHHPPLEPSR